MQSARSTCTRVLAVAACVVPLSSVSVAAPLSGSRFVFWCKSPKGLKHVTHVTPQVWVPGDTYGKAHYPGFPQSYWSKRGVLALAWKGGYCNKQNSDEQFAEDWGGAEALGFRGIAIDEMGSGDEELDARMGRALVRTKRAHPGLFIAVWNSGGLTPTLMDAYRQGADLVMLELYVGGTSGFEKRFAGEVAAAREGGIIHKTVIALGINDAAKPEVLKQQGAWANSKDALEAQVRWIREHAPEMPGLGVFAPHGSPELVRAADGLCGRYFPAVRPAPPFRTMYGYGDEAAKAWRETFRHFNIVTGRTKDAGLVKRLRAQGTLFAYHVLNTFDEKHRTVADFLREWSAPFEEGLGGRLAGGFDAIAIDELHATPDGRPEAEVTVAALRELRRRYPSKLVLAWGEWRIGIGGSQGYYGRDLAHGVTFDRQLEAVRDCCDLFLFECYISESNPQFDCFTEAGANLQARIPGLLGKTTVALGLSQLKDYNYDDRDDVDYGEFLGRQFKLLATDPALKQTPGVAFWAFYRAKPETLPKIHALVDRYYPAARRGTPLRRTP